MSAETEARVREALDAFYKDNHRWSTRPCVTCAAITAASGISFGCDRMAGRAALAPATAGEGVFSLPAQGGQHHGYRTIQDVLRMHVSSSESMEGTYERVGTLPEQEYQQGFTKGLKRAIEIADNWTVRNGAMVEKPPQPVDGEREGDRLLKDASLGLKVLYTIGKSRSFKTVGKVELPDWGKPVMETCESLIEEIDLYLLRDAKVIRSAAPKTSRDAAGEVFHSKSQEKRIKAQRAAQPKPEESEER